MDNEKNPADSSLTNPVPRKKARTAPPRETIIRQLEEDRPATVEPEVEFLRVERPEVQVLETGATAKNPICIDVAEAYTQAPIPVTVFCPDGSLFVGYRYFNYVREVQQINDINGLPSI